MSVSGTGSGKLPSGCFVPVQVLAPCRRPAGRSSYSLLSRAAYQLERPSSGRAPSRPGPPGSPPPAGAGMSTSCPSPTPCGLGLGPTNPLRSVRAAEPLGIRRWGFAPHFALLIPTFALVSRPPGLALRLHPADDAPLPPPAALVIPRFGTRLNPVTLSARRSSTSELLRTLSRMAASKPTSWLSGQRHFLAYSDAIWGP